MGVADSLPVLESFHVPVQSAVGFYSHIDDSSITEIYRCTLARSRRMRLHLCFQSFQPFDDIVDLPDRFPAWKVLRGSHPNDEQTFTPVACGHFLHAAVSCVDPEALDEGAHDGGTRRFRSTNEPASLVACDRRAFPVVIRACRPWHTEPKRVTEVDRISLGESIQVHPASEPDGILLGAIDRLVSEVRFRTC
jgi:hypothetical protein